MKKLFISIIVILGVMIMGSVYADTKIAIVDYQAVLHNSPSVTAEQAKLRKDFLPQQNDIIAQQDKLKKMLAQLKRDSAVMKDKDKKALEDNITKTRNDLMTMTQSFQQKLMTAQQTAMQTVLKQIETIVAQVAKEQNIDLVLPKDGVIYAKDNLDVTDAVVKAIKK